MSAPATLGQLKESGYRPRSVKQEMRENLSRKLRNRDDVFPGVIGYDKTVVPQICNAILSAHDFILLGLRGQAKTRILRSLSGLLDEKLPVVTGCDLRDDPLAPVSETAHRLIAEHGDDTPIEWIGRDERYREKLATPDVTIADLIGDVDPIKAATRKLSFADPEVVSFGIVPRSNRGIFAINELPDLQARIQVGLLNILEEGDVQIRGFPLRLPLDICLVFSANPEDYTNRGNIITPLRDRIASQILTHYPRTRAEGLEITRQEAWTERASEVAVTVPEFVEVLVEEVAIAARASEFVDQNSGVSARVSIALLENVVSNAERRALRLGEATATARPSDVLSGLPALTGKIELVYEGEREGVQSVAQHLVGLASKVVFDAHFPDAYASGGVAGVSGGLVGGLGASDASAAGSGAAPGGADDASPPSAYQDLLEWFRSGHTVDVSDDLSDAELGARFDAIPGLRELAARHLPAEDPGSAVAAMELVLEGLHQSSLLARQELVEGRVYCDVFDEMARSLDD